MKAVLSLFIVMVTTVSGIADWKYLLAVNKERGDAASTSLLVDMAPPGTAVVDFTDWMSVSSKWQHYNPPFYPSIVELSTGYMVTQPAGWNEALAYFSSRRRGNKSASLKLAENEFLQYLMYVNEKYDIDVTTDSTFQGVMAALRSSTKGDRIDRLEAALTLRTMWDIVLFHGGRWGEVEFHEEFGE